MLLASAITGPKKGWESPLAKIIHLIHFIHSKCTTKYREKKDRERKKERKKERRKEKKANELKAEQRGK